jgi:hypothetical protein
MFTIPATLATITEEKVPALVIDARAERVQRIAVSGQIQLETE